MAGGAGRKSYKFTANKKQNKFLNSYLRTHSITKSADELGISRQTHYDWLSDDTYKMRFQQIKSQLGDELEESAYDRALNGHQEPVLGKDGTVISYRTVWHDGLTQFILKGFKPDKYGDKIKQEISTEDNGLMWEEDTNGNNNTVLSDAAVAQDDTS